jgi:Ser/Thr protein kinase RdoA (MazF antagonist)
MMTLSLMTRFFATVGPDWRSPIADQIVARWLNSEADARRLRASANFVFTVRAAEQRYILRFNHESERQPSAIAAELEFIEHLAGRGVHAARPILSLAGNALESVATDLGVFHAVLFEALPGQHLEFAELTPDVFAAWGRALGELHAASRGYRSTGRPTWHDHVTMAREIIPRHLVALRAELDRLEEALHGLPVDDAEFGLIHSDFELDNIKWHEGRPGIVDFDDCACYWFAADIAYALRDLFVDRPRGVDLNDSRFQSFIQGYRSARHIADSGLHCLPLFLRLHNLVSFARICRSLGDGPEADEPPWTSDLRQRLNAKLATYIEGRR